MANTEISYVRTEMLQEQAPPALNVGPIGWMRNNLFPNVMSGVLTVIAIYLIFSLLSGILPWIFGGVWNASSLSECREILKTKYGEGVDAACWAVIHERFWQLMYGFYPGELYWRPNLAFILLFAAIAPVLFEGAPRKMFLISMAAPFLIPWLLWGGTIWAPIMAAPTATNMTPTTQARQRPKLIFHRLHLSPDGAQSAVSCILTQIASKRLPKQNSIT